MRPTLYLSRAAPLLPHAENDEEWAEPEHATSLNPLAQVEYAACSWNSAFPESRSGTIFFVRCLTHRVNCFGHDAGRQLWRDINGKFLLSCTVTQTLLAKRLSGACLKLPRVML